MKKIYFLLFALAFAFSACEKDDICDGSTPTTSRVVIEFYDFNNPAVLKTVPNLRIMGTGASLPLLLSSTNKVQLPLRTTIDNTQYTLTVNFGNANPNVIFTDTLDFNYTRKETYISRACGFKTSFELVPPGLLAPIVINNDATLDEGTWIRNIQILSANIENETQTHVKIFF